jgi:hypothetical protein
LGDAVDEAEVFDAAPEAPPALCSTVDTKP